MKTVRNLASGLIDYAGLFPPAGLGMRAAAEEYARALASADAWMLGRFVVPAGRLDELEREAGDLLGGSPARPWTLSVLAGPDLETAGERCRRFDREHRAARVEAIEWKPAGAGELAAAAEVFRGRDVFCELPHDPDPGELLEAVAGAGLHAKIRTGAVTADGFPTAAELARFVVRAAAAGVAFKATAGLHHALRGEYPLTYAPESPTGTMHGFVNLFLAAAWVQARGWDEAQNSSASKSSCEAAVEALLEERSAAAFHFTDAEVRWRDHRLSADEIAAARQRFALSYGSCSFAEPVDELRQLTARESRESTT